MEAEGVEMIVMCSKTYLLKQEDGVKISCKGVNKIEKKLKVIQELKPVTALNRGI